MIHLQEGEHIRTKARKHWFMLARGGVGITIIGLLPFLMWRFISTQLGVPAETLSATFPSSLVTFLTSTWLLILWVWFFTLWTEYFLDVWVVTDRRVINIEQKSLFHREQSTLRMERIQDVTTEVSGIVATVLDFGDIYVQTAGETREFVIKGIGKPDRVKQTILEYLDKTVERGHTTI